jgi:FkbM family methyltransferase
MEQPADEIWPVLAPGQGMAAEVSLALRTTPWGDDVGAYIPDISLDPEFLRSGTSWEHELTALSLAVRPGDLIVDVGASFGYLTCYLAHLAGPSGTVHAIEPSTAMFSLLIENARRNGHRAVRASRVAVGSAAAEATLWLSSTNLGRHSLHRANVPGLAGQELVQQLTMDEYWRTELGGRPVGLLKVDVEGSELAVLRSAQSMLRSTREVWLEFWPDGIEVTGSDPYKVLGLLGRAGFEITSWNLLTGERQQISDARRLRDVIAEARAWVAGDGQGYSPIVYLRGRRRPRSRPASWSRPRIRRGAG